MIERNKVGDFAEDLASDSNTVPLCFFISAIPHTPPFCDHSQHIICMSITYNQCYTIRANVSLDLV